MPKEQIVYRTSHVFDAEHKQVDEGRPGHVLETPEGGSSYSTAGLFVQWSRDPGYAQIAIEVDVDHLREIMAAIDAGNIPENDEDTVNLHIDLTRSQMNETIRTVRRARNAAFGADE